MVGIDKPILLDLPEALLDDLLAGLEAGAAFPGLLFLAGFAASARVEARLPPCPSASPPFLFVPVGGLAAGFAAALFPILPFATAGPCAAPADSALFRGSFCRNVLLGQKQGLLNTSQSFTTESN